MVLQTNQIPDVIISIWDIISAVKHQIISDVSEEETTNFNNISLGTGNPKPSG